MKYNCGADLNYDCTTHSTHIKKWITTFNAPLPRTATTSGALKVVVYLLICVVVIVASCAVIV
jgi:hypothetical protein